jgi:hypothetical protein
MNFYPPANARIIDANDLINGKNIFEGPTFIKGNIASGKSIISKGSLWIDGNVADGDISVSNDDIQQAYNTMMDRRLNEAANTLRANLKSGKKEGEIGFVKGDRTVGEVEYESALQKAAEEGLGLHIRGNVEVRQIAAPNITVEGNVSFSDVLDKDNLIEGWFTDGTTSVAIPRCMQAAGGYLHIDGNVTGRQSLQKTCASIEQRSNNQPDHILKMGRALDRIHATGPIRISGKLSDCCISGNRGSIITKKAISGYVIVLQGVLNQETAGQIINSPPGKDHALPPPIPLGRG